MVRLLQETEVENWAWQKGTFAPSTPLHPQSTKQPTRIRILLAQPVSTFRHAIPDILVNGNILQGLGLPAHTFSALQLSSGIYSSHCLPEGSTIATCKSLSFIFRTPQLKDCSIGGLSVSYDFETGVTTALILGYAFDLDKLHLNATDTPEALVQFLQQLNDCRHCWEHPLLLPCLFLLEHARRVQAYVTRALSRRVVLVEHSIGITKAGRSGMKILDFGKDYLHADDEKLFDGEHMQRQNAKKLVGTSM